MTIKSSYYERHMWPLTSGTTCYTGARKVLASSTSLTTEETTHYQESGLPVALPFATTTTTRTVTTSQRTASWATRFHTGRLFFTDNDDRTVTAPSIPGTDDENIPNEERASRNTPLAGEEVFLQSRLVHGLDLEQHNKQDGSSSPLTFCVGYSAGVSWECLALLQAMPRPAPNETTTNANSNPEGVHADSASVRGGGGDDNASVASTTAASQADTYRRTVSSSTVGAPFNEPILGNSSNVVSFQLGSVVKSNGGEEALPASLEKPASHLVVRRIMARGTTTTRPRLPPRHEGGLDDAMASIHAEPIEFTMKLEVRPLAPTLVEFTSSTNDDEPFPSWGVIMGSADHSKLAWFAPIVTSSTAKPSTTVSSLGIISTTPDSAPRLEQTFLDDPAFTFLSPVMAMDHLCLGSITRTTTRSGEGEGAVEDGISDTHCLAVACQDGTVRLILFERANGPADQQPFVNCRHAQVIVDGPIVCISLQHMTVTKDDGRTYVIHVTAGSLCGYAMELVLSAPFATSSEKTTSHAIDETPLQRQLCGPFMVVQDLWSEALGAQDSVLAVHACGNFVVLGTFCGRVLVYVKHDPTPEVLPPQRDDNVAAEEHDDGDDDDDDENAYQLEWACQLPYSIHGVCISPTESTASAGTASKKQIVVTTRRSIHIFDERSESKAVLQARRLAAVVKERSQKLLLSMRGSEENAASQTPEQAAVDSHVEESGGRRTEEGNEAGTSESRSKDIEDATISDASLIPTVTEVSDAVASELPPIITSSSTDPDFRKTAGPSFRETVASTVTETAGVQAKRTVTEKVETFSGEALDTTISEADPAAKPLVDNLVSQSADDDASKTASPNIAETTSRNLNDDSPGVTEAAMSTDEAESTLAIRSSPSSDTVQ